MANLDLQGLLFQSADKYGVPRDLALRVFNRESGGEADRIGAVSRRGAIGPMQLMADTASELGVNPYNPAENIDGGVRYLKQQLDDFGTPELAVAAYNAGPGRVRRAGGIPDIKETRDYVAAVAGSGAAPGLGDGASIFGLDQPGAPADAGPDAGAGDGAVIFGLKADAAPQQPAITPPPRKPAAPESDETSSVDGPHSTMPEDDTVVFDKATGRYDQPGMPTARFWQDPVSGEHNIDLYQGADSPERQARLAKLYEQQSGRRAAADDLLRYGRNSDRALEIEENLFGGFGNELMAAGSAAGTVESNLADLVRGKRPAYSPADAYTAFLNGTNAQLHDYETAHPKEALAIGAVSSLPSLLVPVGGEAATAARESSLLARMGSGARTGAVFGGVSGFGRGQGGVGERTKSALFGAGAGGALGFVAPPVIEGIANGGQGIYNAFRSPAAKAAVAATKLDDKAAAALARGIERDEESPAAVAARLRGGKRVPTYQQLGDNAATIAEVMASVPGRGQTIVRDAARDFQASEADAIKRDIADSLGGRGDYFDTADAIMAKRAADAAPFRDAAFSNQMDPALYDKLIAPVMPRVPKSAMKYAAEIAKREGRNPDELGLVEMSSEPPTNNGPATRPDPFFERAYDMVRKQKEGRDMRGDSLLEFISKRGGLNEPGELGQMDAQTWHRAKPFMRKLIQDNGDSADGMALRAWEAGYFPNLNERPTPNDLFNAIRGELAGKKVYATPNDVPSVQLKAYADALERRLSDADIDPKAVKPREAWRKLFDHEAETHSMQDLAEEGTASRSPVTDLGFEERPTLESLHYIKKGIDQELDSLKDPVTGQLDLEGNPLAGATAGVRSVFGKALRKLDANYDIFMQRWGDESQHLDALRLGHAVLKPSVKSELLTRRVGEMSPTEKLFFQKGVGEALLEAAKSRGGVAAMRQLVKSEEVGAKVRQAFPSAQAFNDFLEIATQRVRSQERNNTVMMNSRTMPRQEAARDLRDEGFNPYDTAADFLTLDPRAVGKSVLKQALKGVPRKDKSVLGNPETNRRLAEMLVDPERAAQALEGLTERAQRRANGAGRRIGRRVPAYAGEIAAEKLSGLIAPPRRKSEGSVAR